MVLDLQKKKKVTDADREALTKLQDEYQALKKTKEEMV
jgi:hypothetical protein